MVLFGVSAAIALTFRRHQKESIFIGSSPHLFAAFGTWVAARIRRRPFVFEVRDLWPESYAAVGDGTTTGLDYRFLRRMALLLYRQADRIVVLAEPNRERIAAQGVDVDKIFYVPNGVNLEDFPINPSRPSELDGHQIRFIYAGAHGPANGLEVVLQACAELQRQGRSDIEIILVGDGPAKPSLVSLAAGLGLHNLQFLDPVAKEDIPALLGTAHAGLMILAPSELFAYGISPNKLYDYLAAGLPVVTNVPGLVTDIVVEANAGITCEAGSAEALADAMTAMATVLGQDATRFDHGRDYVTQHFDRRILAEHLSEMLEQLLSD
jgi:glycosyltransferase involved in cell wall biosynthesis